jgi:hypothetical protein
VSLPGSYGKTDFDNSGKVDSASNFLYFNLGAKVQLGSFGTTITGEFLRYTVPSSTGGPSLSLTAGRWHGLLAYGFVDDQIVVGAGVRAVSMQLSASGGTIPNPTQGALLTMTGLAPEVGILFKPNELPFRIGVTARGAVNGGTFGASQAETGADGVSRAGSLILPDRITLPSELEGGFALQVGPRPLNPQWINPHDQDSPVRERIAWDRARRARENDAILNTTPAEGRASKRAELARAELAIRAVEDQRLAAEEKRLLAQRRARFANWPRERILLLASVLVTGATTEAVSLEGFLNQQHDQYGQKATLSPRFGIESEPVANLIRGRIGSYIEPSLFQGGNSRQHFTFGGDVKLLPFDTFGLTKDQVWRLGVGLDAAPRYINYGLSLGAWH